MKHKILALLLVMVLSVCGVCYQGVEAKAEDMGEDMDFSLLINEDTLVGTVQDQTWGIYLAEGNSYISKISSTKIGAGGDTMAARKCQVSVTSIVERLVNGSWVRHIMDFNYY